MLEAQSNIRHANGKEKVNKDDPQLMGEAKTAMNDLFDVNVNSGDKLSLDDRVAMLNADKRRVFEGVKSRFLHQRQHEANECQCDFKPLRMFVSGVGGTGKSFLIEAIKALVASISPD